MAWSTTPVYDISGEKPVLGDMPHEQVQAAIASGKFSFPKGQEINVVSPDGTPGTIPAENAPDAFKNGYQYATPKMLSAQADKEHYGSLEQQTLAGVEGVAQGLVGPAAPLAERALGVNPEEIRKRSEANPWTHGIGEAAGFGLGLLGGTGEAQLLGLAGEAAAAKIAGEGIASRLAAGGAKMATEIGLYQAGDEASKAILQDPNQTVGSAVSNIGLSALLGAGLGAPLAGIGMAAKGVVNSQVLSDFADRLAFRGSNLDINEKLMHEFENANNLYHEMGSEVGGANGIRAQAMKSLLPEVNEHIVGQAQDLANQMNATAERLAKTGDKSGMVDQLQRQASRIEDSINPQVDPLTMQPKAPLDSANIYDTLNGVKRQLGEWGKFNKDFVPLNEVAFRNSAKSLGHSIKVALEDEGIWGKAGGLQKDLNAAWADAIPAMKDAESKFMTKVGGDRVVDPAKFNTYLNQNGKATTETIRQQMMGKFIDAVDKFHGATAKAYEAAGVENPFQQASMTSLKESLNVPSTGSKLADLWYDKLGAKGLGEGLGIGVGTTLGHKTLLPGGDIIGAMIGKDVFGPAFTSIIKPLMEKGASMPAFQSSMAYVKAVLKGDDALAKAAAKVFGSEAETLPSHLFPDHQEIEKLDQKLKNVAQNPGKMINVASNLGHYMPDHAQAVSQTAMTAVNFLNAQRPQNPKMGPLDTDIPVSKAQMAPYYRMLSIAQQPLTVLQHIKDGTLLPQDVNTLKTLYPNYYNKMSQEVMSAMTNHLSEGKTIPYRLRQSASLLLGQPLDSTMQPASIQSIQTAFAANKAQAQAQAQQRVKKGTSKLSKIASNMQTPDQAAAERAMKGS